jgi:hypothetical protein
MNNEQLEMVLKQNEPIIKKYNLNKLDLLIMEDNPEQIKILDDIFYTNVPARPLFRSKKIVENLNDAVAELKTGNYGAVISDVFTPSSSNNDSELRIELYELLKQFLGNYDKRCLTAINKWKDDDKMLAPMGLKLAQAAIEANVPIVFCSSENHHGDNSELINRWTYKNPVPYIDPVYNPVTFAKTDQKDWNAAFQKVVSMFTGVREVGYSDSEILENIFNGNLLQHGLLPQNYSEKDIIENINKFRDVKKIQELYGID